MNFLLSLDVGTTSVKAGLFDSAGTCRATSFEEYQLITPASDQAELKPETYWSAAKNTIHNVLVETGINVSLVKGLAVSSQGETLIVLDKANKPLRNAIVWMDNRAIDQTDDLKERLGPQVYEKTGIPEVVPTWPACKILWLKENEPDVFQRADKFLLVQDYLVFRLTGNFVTDGSISCTTLLYDIVEHKWWQKALNAVGINEGQLAILTPVGSIAGKLTKAAAIELDLPETVSIVCGGMDQSVGAIGAGNIDQGVVSETTGAALAIQVSIRDPMIDPNRVTPVYVHSIPDCYLFVPVCPTAGMAFKWFKDNFILFGDPNRDVDPYDLMNDLAEKIAPGCDGLLMLPHLMGAFSPESNPFARGSFTGFTLLHGKGHFVRAIQEAVAFMLRQNIDSVRQTGIEVMEIRTSGGASRSKVWNQIKADVCGIPIIRLENEDTALVGDAILAGVACGLFLSINEACKLMVHTTSPIFPTSATAAYANYYKKYLDLDSNLNTFFRKNYSNGS